MIRAMLALLALAPLAYSAPLPKVQKAELYYPVQVGAKRVIDYGDKVDVTETVDKVEMKDGKYFVTVISTYAGKPKRNSHILEVSAKGIVEFQGEEMGEPVIALKLPAKEGDSW